MSAENVGWVFRRSPFTGRELLVHLALADSSNDANEDEIWFTLDVLAEKARVTRTTAKVTVEKLCDSGLMELVTQSRGRTPSRYRMLFPHDALIVFAYRRQPTNHSLVNPPMTGGLEVAPNPPMTDAQPTNFDESNPPKTPRARKEQTKVTQPKETNMAMRQRNSVFDAITGVCGFEPPFPKSVGPRVGKVERELRQAHHDLDDESLAAEITTRAARYVRMYREAALTPEALLKHWSALTERGERIQSPSQRALFARQTNGDPALARLDDVLDGRGGR